MRLRLHKMRIVDPVDTYRMLPRLERTATLGCIFILFYSLQFVGSGIFHIGSALRVASVGILIAGASLFFGFVLGFIFGIPRTPKPPAATPSSGSGSQTSQDADFSPVQPNTNLLEISDWLTKMLVGVSLVELYKVSPLLRKLAGFLGPGLRDCDSPSCVGSSESFAIGIVIFFFGVGFLIGYLWTNLYYSPDLRRALKGARDEGARRDKDLWQLTTDARELRQEGRVDEPLRMVDLVLQEDPAHPAALFEKGRILKKLAQAGGKPGNKALLQEAFDYASRAADQMPNKGGPRYNMACYQALLGVDRAKVLENLKQAVLLNPKLREEARKDEDFVSVREDPEFKELTKEPPPAS